MLESIKEVGIEEGILIGREEGRREGILIGIEEGILIGEILMAQRILKQDVYSREELNDKNFGELNNILAEFEGKLN